MMNFNKLILSCVLGFVVTENVFASKQNSPLMFESASTFDSAPTQELFMDSQIEKSCARPCQLSKYCIIRYKDTYKPEQNLFVPENDEVHDELFRAQIQRLAQEVSFRDSNGQIIKPIPNEKRPGYSQLPLGKNNCPDYMAAKKFLEDLSPDYKPTSDSCKLAEQFKAIKSFYAGGYCGISSSSDMSMSSSMSTEIDGK